ncbi:outer membrane beta-barrel protein [Maribacter aestuarii]|uniref:outer membrane beta-barrel protein n=1 Tax=Maribacter aestuarii TaxID=1130723 RepID=UPI0025A623A2|nr:outer membrane beta-barrel protein [Maribacter aestuarii]
MKIFLVVCIFITALSTTHAQEISTKGKIVDEFNSAVPYASVVFKSDTSADTVFGVLSEEDGSFSISLEKDRYTLEITVVGLQSTTSSIDLTSAGETYDLGAILLKTVALDEVVVKNRNSPYKLNLDKKEYKVSGDLFSKGGTLSDVIQNVPSVQIDANGALSLRGSADIIVLLNGKPSGLTASTDLLRSIPASSIDKIEVITNPSGKYVAQGSAGILNIVLKKGKAKGFNGSVEIFGGHRLNAGSNININGANDKSSWYINSGVGYSEPKGKNSVELQNFETTPDRTSQNSERIRKQLYGLVNIGGAHDIRKNQNMSGSFTYRRANANNDNATFYNDFENTQLLASSERLEDENEKNDFLQGEINYSIELDTLGQVLKIGADGQFIQSTENSEITENETFPEMTFLNTDRTFSSEDNQRFLLSVDYELPLNKNQKLELGYLGSFKDITNDFEVVTGTGSEFVPIPEFTNSTTFRENIHSFYVQLGKKYEKIAYQLSLRSELTDIALNDANNTVVVDKNFTDWFPSAFINYNPNEEEEYRLSFTRRILRPSGFIYLPFSSYTDERNIFVGDPDINPSYTFSSELGYSYKISNSLTLTPTLYFRNTEDEVEFFVEKRTITINEEEREVFASTLTNIGTYTAYGLELGVSYKPANWWDIYFESTFNGFNQKGNVRGASFDGTGVLIYGRLNHTVNLSKKLKVQWQNNYRGPIETGQYRRKGIYAMNMGLNYDIFKGNGAITLNVVDVLNSNIRRVTSFGSDFTRDLELQNRVRQINLSLSYRFDPKSKTKQGNQYDKNEIIN